MPDNNDVLQKLLLQSSAYDLGHSGGAPRPPSFPMLGNLGPNSTIGKVAGMAMPMASEYLRSYFDQFGFSMGGGNLYDNWQSREYQLGLMRTQQQMSQLDQLRAQDLMRGFLITSGERSTVGADGRRILSDPRMEAALGRTSADMGTILSVMARIAPDSVDTVLLGSRAVAAGSIYEGARMIPNRAGVTNSVDPGRLTSALMGEMFGNGPEIDLRRTYGMLGRPTGEAFTELVRRGVINGGDGSNPEDIAKNAGKQLDQYLGAIKAVKEVFGDLGNPNAPMREVINALQGLTAGGLGVYDPSELRRIVTQFQQVAKDPGSPLGYEGAFNAISTEQVLARRYGLSDRMAIGAEVRAESSRRAYLMNQYQPSLYASDEAQFRSVVAQRRMSGAASQHGNLIGAVLELSGATDANSPFGKVAAAIAAGRTTVNINGVDVNTATLGLADFESLAQQSGMGGHLVQQLNSPSTNKIAYEAAPGAARTIEESQRLEMSRTLEGRAVGRDGGRFIAKYGWSRIMAAIQNNLSAKSPALIAQRVAGELGVPQNERPDFVAWLQVTINQMGELTKAYGGAGTAVDALRASSGGFMADKQQAIDTIGTGTMFRDAFANARPETIGAALTKLLMDGNTTGMAPGIADALKQVLGGLSNEEASRIAAGLSTGEPQAGVLGGVGFGLAPSGIGQVEDRLRQGAVNRGRLGGLPRIDKGYRIAGVTLSDEMNDELDKARISQLRNNTPNSGVPVNVKIAGGSELRVVIDGRLPNGALTGKGVVVTNAPETIPPVK